MVENIEVFTQSSIRIRGDMTVYLDPYRMTEAAHDADFIFITHDHGDHFSEEDIAKVIKDDTRFVVPKKLEKRAKPLVPAGGKLIVVSPESKEEVDGLYFETVPAYNNRKAFHPKSAGWVGYILSMGGKRIYAAGDTDMTPDNQKVSCDIALVPIGGTYTMEAKEAAKLVNVIKPQTAIPIHYGSIVGKLSDADVFRANVNEGIEVVEKIC